MRPLMFLTPLFALLLGCSADALTEVEGTQSAPHSRFFVSADGSQIGDGSFTNPWALATALAHPGVVQPGDTIWLRGGTYQGVFNSKLNGAAGVPVVLRQYPGERATIDGRLNINGNYAYYWGFEVMYSDLDRVSAIVGSDPSDLPRAHKGVHVYGSFNKLINIVVHDVGHNFASASSEGLEVYGSLFYNNGWIGPEMGWGQHLYYQNAGAPKVIRDNVMFGSYGEGVQIYSSTAQLRNFHVEGNAIFSSGDPAAPEFGYSENFLSFGAENGLYHGPIVIRANSIYHRDPSWISVHLSYPYLPAGSDISFEDNIVNGQSLFWHLNNWTIKRNKLSSTRPILLQMKSGQSFTAHAIDYNAYASTAGSVNTLELRTPTPFSYTLAQWQAATGYDLNSSFVSRLPGADIVYRPNSYERGRGFIHCWNWDGAATLSVDLSRLGVAVGEQFQIHHVYDIFGAPIASGIYTGGTVGLGQTGYVPPAPIGDTAPPSTSPRFNVFLVRRL